MVKVWIPLVPWIPLVLYLAYLAKQMSAMWKKICIVCKLHLLVARRLVLRASQSPALLLQLNPDSVSLYLSSFHAASSSESTSPIILSTFNAPGTRRGCTDCCASKEKLQFLKSLHLELQVANHGHGPGSTWRFLGSSYWSCEGWNPSKVFENCFCGFLSLERC